MKPVVVIGATGRTGHLVVKQLLDAGRTVRVLSRSASKAHAKLGDAINVHEGDVRDPESLRGLGLNAAGAICCMGSNSYFGKNGTAAVDTIGTRNLVQALESEGVPHFVFMSAFGLDRRSIFLDIFSLALGNYFVHKAHAEDAVRASTMPWTIVRPVELRNRPPRMPVRLNQREPLSLLRAVSRDAVAEVLVDCLGNEAAMSKTFELCEGGTEDFATQLAQTESEESRPRPTRTPLVGR